MTFLVFTLLFVGPYAPRVCLPALKACWKAVVIP